MRWSSTGTLSSVCGQAGLIFAIAQLACGAIPAPRSDEVAARAERLVREDLSLRFSVDPEDIEVVLTEPETWANTCLELGDGPDCEERETSGYRVVLRLPTGQEHTYHTDREEAFRAVIPSPPPLPQVFLRYEGEEFRGQLGSGCWQQKEPDGAINEQCWDAEVVGSSPGVSVQAGRTGTLIFQAHRKPTDLTVQVIAADDRSPPVVIDTAPGVTVPLEFDQPVGRKLLRVAAAWPEGSLSFTFAMEVN